MKFDKFKVPNNETGEEIVFDILFTFESEVTKKHYMVYTDNREDATGNIQVFASIYNPEDETPVLEAIESEAEWTVIEEIIAELNNQKLTKEDIEQ